MNKKARHQLILELVQNRPVQSQDLLRSLLAEKGFKVTQSTLSRDLKELELVKGATGYRIPAEPVAANQRVEEALANLMLRCIAAQNLVVLRTGPGHAPALAAVIDGARIPLVLGTVAGDDTVLLVTRTERDAGQLADRLNQQARGPNAGR